MPAARTDLAQRIDAVRRFNRFYTQRIGVLNHGLLNSPFSLTEARLLYELAARDGLTAAGLSRDLGLDPGYLSRMLRGFERRGLIEKRPSASDGRQSLLSLTGRGRKTFAPLNTRASDEIAAMLAPLHPADQARLVEAIRTIQALLGVPPEEKVPYLLRPPQPGDIGWVIHRHGVLYAEEYGWDETFEALVAVIAGRFVENFDPKRERCWIAEKDGENVGSVFLAQKSKTVAKLRLLLVEPKARGLGLGTRLVNECVRFARQAGYRKLELWTNSVLLAARRIYKRIGFELVAEEPYHGFGHDLIGETWELKL